MTDYPEIRNIVSPPATRIGGMRLQEAEEFNRNPPAYRRWRRVELFSQGFCVWREGVIHTPTNWLKEGF